MNEPRSGFSGGSLDSGQAERLLRDAARDLESLEPGTRIVGDFGNVGSSLFITRGARIIANGTEESLRRVLGRGCWSELEYFGGDGIWQVREDDGRDQVAFSLSGREAAQCVLPLAGQHNRMNALAAMAAARHVGITPAVAADAPIPLGRPPSASATPITPDPTTVASSSAVPRLSARSR